MRITESILTMIRATSHLPESKLISRRELTGLFLRNFDSQKIGFIANKHF